MNGVGGVNQTTRSAHEQLMTLLDEGGAEYRVIHHEPEGVTSIASRLRGHALAQAAKCIVVRIKLSKKVNKFVLAVVPGDQLVALDVLRGMWDGTYVSFATRETAEELSGCVSGTIIPFSFHDDLELVVAENLLAEREIFFNAARLDVSLALTTSDYTRLANPRVAAIAQAPPLAEAG